MKYLKYILVIIALFTLKYMDYAGVLVQEIKPFYISNIMASNLYYDTVKVSNEKIDVIDYYVYEDLLFITPIKNNVMLPISGMIYKVKKDYISIEANGSIYEIYNIKSNYLLYQYYQAGSILGKSDEVIIKSSEYDNIINNIMINNEMV